MLVPFYCIHDKWCFFEVIKKYNRYEIEPKIISNKCIQETTEKLFNNLFMSDNMLVLTYNKEDNFYCYYDIVKKHYYNFEIKLLIIIEINDVCYEFDNYNNFLNYMLELYKYIDYIEFQIENME